MVVFILHPCLVFVVFGVVVFGSRGITPLSALLHLVGRIYSPLNLGAVVRHVDGGLNITAWGVVGPNG